MPKKVSSLNPSKLPRNNPTNLSPSPPQDQTEVVLDSVQEQRRTKPLISSIKTKYKRKRTKILSIIFPERAKKEKSNL